MGCPDAHCTSAPNTLSQAGLFPWVQTWRGQLVVHPERRSMPQQNSFDFRHLFGMHFPPIRLTESVEVAISSNLALPALQVGAELLKIIRSNLVTVVTGSTGCGKTTIVPLLLFLQHKNARLLIALPRRIATQMAAERLRQLLGDQRLGQTVGYHVGHEEACKSNETRLLFVTAGMLRKYVSGALRQMRIIGQSSSGYRLNEEVAESQKLRSIFPYDFVLVDEVHERTMDCDMALLLLKCLAVKMTTAAIRARMQLPLFRIVVMSATISANDFSTFLSGESLNIFEAEHSAWMDRTCLLQVKGTLQAASQGGTLPSSTKAGLDLTTAEMQGDEMSERECLIRRARSLVTPMNELARLWKTRRTKDLVAVFQEQHLSMPSRPLCKVQHWRHISGTARVRANCVEVARRTNFPVEELFWDDIVDLARASMTASAADLLDIASPTLLRYMGIDPEGGEVLQMAAQQGPMEEQKPRASLNREGAFHYLSPWHSDAGTELNDDDEMIAGGDNFCSEEPRLNYWCVESAARLLLLIHVQCLLRNASQPGVLVFLPGKPEISRMEQALDKAKADAAVALSNARDDPQQCFGPGVVHESDGTVQLSVDLQILRIHRDAETEDLKHAKQHAPSSTCMKIILATNIAESSITFVDVSIVVDFALVKEKHVHAVTKAHRLQLRWASRAALDQRRGRAGRVREGAYLCLIPRELYKNLEPFPLPELQRLPLEDVLMDVMAAFPGESTDASLFFLSQAQNPPDIGKVYEALCNMEASGALRLRSPSSLFTHMTPLGQLACSLALPVKVARIILLSKAYGVLPAGLWAASLLLSDRQTVFECQPRGAKTSSLPDAELLRWLAARSWRLGFASRQRDRLFPLAAQRWCVQSRSKCEPADWPTMKTNESEQVPWLRGSSCTGSDDTSSSIWGEFIPCDICVDVVAMLHLHKLHGNTIYQLQSHLTLSAEKLQQRNVASESASGLPHTVQKMKRLRRFLAMSGMSVQGVADVASQHQAISRKLSRFGSLRCAESCRAMPAPSSIGSHSNEAIEGLVWRLQLVLASACMPFGFSRVRDSSMQTPFNLGQKSVSHFSFNVLCHEAFRQRPDLRCRDALLTAAKRGFSESPTSPSRFHSGGCGSPPRFATAESQNRPSTKVFPCIYSPYRGDVCAGDSTLDCMCSISFPEGYSEVPSIRQGHLEGEANSHPGTEAELNKQRWSQQYFAEEMGLLLRNSCSTAFCVRMAAVLLKETDPLALFSDSSCIWHRTRDMERGTRMLLYQSFRTWVNRQRRNHAQLSEEFDRVCLRLETFGILKGLQVGTRCHAKSQSMGLSRPTACFGPGNAPVLDLPSSGKSQQPISPSEWLGAMRSLEMFTCRLLLFAARTRMTRRLVQLMHTALVDRPQVLRQLLREQQGNWPTARSEIDAMDRAREEVAAIFMHPSFSGRLTSCLAPLHFFSLCVRNNVPLSDLLFCEGWDFDFSGILPGAPLGPLLRVQELLGPLLSSSCRALLPTDMQGVAEAVKEFYSSKQVQARQQQARENSKRAKGNGLLRHLEEQKHFHKPTASVWASLVEDAVDNLTAAAETVLARLQSKKCEVGTAQQIEDANGLLSSAAEATQILSAYYRSCGLVHAQPNARRVQILVFGDSHRRALLQWLHRATGGINMKATGKRQAELRGPEHECINQPLWASMLPFADDDRSPTRDSIETKMPGLQMPSTVSHDLSVDEEKIEEQLLEATEKIQRAAGGGIMGASCLEEIMSLAMATVNRLLDIQQAECYAAEQQLERISKPQVEARERPATPEGTSPVKRFLRGAEADRKATLEGSPGPSKASLSSMKDRLPHMHSVKLEADPLARRWHRDEFLRQRQGSRKQFHPLQASSSGGNEAGQGDADTTNDMDTSHEVPFCSVSHRFLKAFLSIDGGGRSRKRQHGGPSTARVCRISEQSILHSNGPFYPESYSREFLLVGLSEWDTSAGLASGGSDVGAASLLPPLPHLEELLLLLLAPVVCIFLSTDCLCYCCKCCPCSPDMKAGAKYPEAKGRSDCPAGTGAGGISHFGSGPARGNCCQLCLRGAVCYAVVSFGGFREFGWVPRFLWKDADIALLNNARSVLSDVFKQPNIGSSGAWHDATKWRDTNCEDSDDSASDSSVYHTYSDEAKVATARFQSKECANGPCIDSILGQLLLPKDRLQYKQLVGATTATWGLRSRGRNPYNASEDPSVNSDIYTTPAGDRGAPCWEKLDHTKQQQGRSESGTDVALSPIVVFDLHGTEIDIPGLSMTPSSACSKRTFLGSALHPPSGYSNRTYLQALQEEANEQHHQAQKSECQTCTHLDSLAMAISKSLTLLHAPQASKTAVLPEGATPSMWGLPVSLLMLRHSPQHPSLSEMLQCAAWRCLPATALAAYAEKLIIQCANSSCRVPLGNVGDLELVSRRHPLPDGPPWAKIAFKYFLEELDTSARTKIDACPTSAHADVGQCAADSATPAQRNIEVPGSTLENTLLQWMQDNELIRHDVAVEVHRGSVSTKEGELWVINTAKLARRHKACETCSVSGTETPPLGCPCSNWPCVTSRCFRPQLVPLLDDEHTSLAKLKLESRLLLTPSSLAFVSTYIKPLLRTRRRLELLLKVKQEEAFHTESSSAGLAEQNRMRQQHSHMVDKFVEWVLCGGPVRHIVGFRIFDFYVFPPDSLVEIAGHTDAQRVYFWRLASSNVVPRNPVDFPQKLNEGPILSFRDALALGTNEGTSDDADRGDSGLLQSTTAFFAAARYIHNYEKGVLREDLETSVTFVEHLAEIIARSCKWTAEKFHLKDSEMYQKFFVDSWDIFRPASAGTGAASGKQRQETYKGYRHQNLNEGQQPVVWQNNDDLSRTVRTVLTAASSNLQGALLPADLFDWQTRLLQKQRSAVLRQMENALLSLPKEWLNGCDWTMSRVALEQSMIWRWSPDREEIEQQQQANRIAHEKRKAAEEDRKVKEVQALRKMLEMEALESSSKRTRPLR